MDKYLHIIPKKNMNKNNWREVHPNVRYIILIFLQGIHFNLKISSFLSGILKDILYLVVERIVQYGCGTVSMVM
jgi:hypothetical protein